MDTLRKYGLLTSAALALLISQGALAQEATPDVHDNDGSDIVVTAQKRTERLLDVPVAVSAVSSQSLVDQNLVSIRDYSTRIPGIQILAIACRAFLCAA